jgi:hypothetical protein
VVDHEDPTCSGVGHVIGAFHGVAEKVHVTPLILVKVRFFSLNFKTSQNVSLNF